MKNSLKNVSMEKNITAMNPLIVYYGNDAQKMFLLSKKKLEMGVLLAVFSFNDGSKLLLDVVKELKVVPGYFLEIFYHNKVYSRVSIMKNKTTLETNEATNETLGGWHSVEF